LAPKATDLGEMTRNNAHYAVHQQAYDGQTTDRQNDL